MWFCDSRGRGSRESVDIPRSLEMVRGKESAYSADVPLMVLGDSLSRLIVSVTPLSR